jgi:hypothetical protein
MMIMMYACVARRWIAPSVFSTSTFFEPHAPPVHSSDADAHD